MTGPYTVTFAIGGEAASSRFVEKPNAVHLANVLDDADILAKVVDADHNVVYDTTVDEDDVIDV